jgi:hypothetical protein
MLLNGAMHKFEVIYGRPISKKPFSPLDIQKQCGIVSTFRNKLDKIIIYD